VYKYKVESEAGNKLVEGHNVDELF